MPTFTKILLLILLGAAAAAAELEIPEAYDLISVNGEEKSGLNLLKTKTVPLNAGRNVIVLEYDELYDSDYGDAFDHVKSQPWALILEADPKQDYRLQSPALDDKHAAQRYAKNPVFTMHDAAARPVAITAVPARELAPASAAPATVASQSSAAPATPGEKTGAATKTPDPLAMLQYWWAQASAEQRAAFRQQLQAEP
jgi:uncharacterized protein YccT (UPF0319 family)